MPIDGSGVYTYPSGTLAVSGNVVASLAYNAFIEDLKSVINAPVPVSRGGHGSTTASGARTALGLIIGTNVQAYDATTNPYTTAEKTKLENIGQSSVVSKSAAYTVVSDDLGRLIRFTTSTTVSLTAAATLGDAFVFEVMAAGGAVTIDPDGSETINGSDTFTVPNGSSATIRGDGTAFYASSLPLGVANMTGSVTAFAMATAPSGWLECDGSAASRTTYANLFALVGTTYGVGDGSTTFNLPDLRGEFIRGWDNGRGVDAGRAIGSFVADELKSHTHTESAQTNGLGVASGGYFTAAISGSSTTGATGGTETRPRSVALMYCIQY